MTPDKGYKRARDLLQKNFGDEFSMCSAYMKKALEWPTIRPEDSKSLQAFAIFLRRSCNAMRDMSYSHEINLSSNMKVLVLKLPYKLRERWRSNLWEFQENQNSRPQFKDLVLFVEKQVRVDSDPVFGDIQDKPLSKTKDKFPTKVKLKSGGSTFATSVSAPDFHSTQQSSNDNHLQVLCHLCSSSNHTLEQCKLFKKKKHREKME